MFCRYFKELKSSFYPDFSRLNFAVCERTVPTFSPLLLPFNLVGRRSHQDVTVDPLSARQQRPFIDRFRASPLGQKILLSLNISYSQICRILFWKTKRDVKKTRGAQESLERHTSDCVKILMKLKLFIMNTGEPHLRRLNYTQILAEFLHIM